MAYFQSGLYIVATNTMAQSNFINRHQNHGLLYSSIIELKQLIDDLQSKKKDIRMNRYVRYHQAKEFCWEIESMKLLTVWENQ